MFIVLGIVVFVMLIIVVALPQLRRKGVDIEGIIDFAKTAINSATKAIDTLSPFLPEGSRIDVVMRIKEAAEIAVGNAEKLTLIGKLPADQREAEARKYIIEAVTLAGIDVTPAVERLIDGAIINAVRLLPKTGLVPEQAKIL